MSFLGGSPFGNVNRTVNLGNVFGGGQSSQQQQQQQQPATNIFGSPGGATPTTTGSVFGTTPQKLFTFGGASTSSAGGGGVFGSTQGASTSAGGGIFGSLGQNAATTSGMFQTQQPTGTSVSFVPFQDKDTIIKGGVSSEVAVKFQTITVMKHYNENKSLEELRLEDYQLNRHRKGTQQQSAGLFGSTVPTPPPQPNLFSSGGTFGTTTTTTPSTSFGGIGLFGQQSNNNNTTASGNLFGAGLFSQQKPNVGLFGATPTTPATTPTTPFGSGGASTGFGSQAANNVFGQQQASNNTGFNFTPGATNLFSTPPQQQQPAAQPQQGLGLFGQSTAPATTSTNLFGSTSAAFGGSTSTTKPLFSFGGGSAFGTTTSTAAPVFGTTTSTTTTTPSYFGTGSSLTTPGFGAPPATSAAAPVSIFGTQQQNPPISTPASSFFGNTSSAFTTPTFSAGSGLTGSTLASGFFNPTANQQQRPISTGGFFGANNTGAATNSTTFRPTFGGLGSGGTFTFGGGTGTGGFNFQPPRIQPLQQPVVQNYQHQPILAPPMVVSFATTPFKDNKLFWANLPAQLPKQLQSSSRQTMANVAKTDREYLQASTRRMRLSAAGPSRPPINITSSPAVRKLTYLASTSKNYSISKYKAKIFDGFEDEDFGVGIDILSPKTNVKRLDLKVLEDPLFDISLQSSEVSSSKGLAQRSREICSERHHRSADAAVYNNNAPIATSSPLFRNRRVRFSLPSFPTAHGENAPSPIYYPGEEDGGGDTGLGNSLGSNSLSVLPSGNSEEAGKPTSPVNKKHFAPGTICGVVNTREGYYLKPSLEELDKNVDAQGNCIVVELEIGRKNFGCIKYLCPVNIVNVNIDKLVHFRHKEVVVYPDDNKKPQLGEGLNVPAVICLERVWPVDKTTNELIRDPDHAKLCNYEQRLQRACKRMGTEFISYNADEGVWSFRVAHF